MTWYDTLTSTPALIAGALGLSASAYLYTRSSPPGQAPVQSASTDVRAHAKAQTQEDRNAKMASTAASVMSPPAANLAPPKDDPISVSELAKYNGDDPSKPIYVAIKGKVYDVTAKPEMYGKGKGYNVFAGKDASKGLGMSSLDPKDAISDYSGLNEAQLKTLNQWEDFFSKRYNIVGKVQE